MNCPKCGHNDTKVIDSRVIDNGKSTRRRRQCEVCGYRHTTFERKGSTELMVEKKDGTKELYVRSKLKRAILLSFAKREVSPEQIDTMIADLETNWSKKWNVVTSKQIWENVIEALREIDPVAYVRFASVYMKFDRFEDFQDLLK